MSSQIRFVGGIVLGTLLFNSFSYADFGDDLTKATSQNVYSIQSTCQSTGQFTAKALEQARNIRAVIERLKDNSACKGLTESMNTTLQSLSSDLNTVQQTRDNLGNNSAAASELDSVSDQMQALRTFSQTMNLDALQADPATQGTFSKASIAAALSRAAMQNQRLQTVANGSPDVEADPTKSLTQAVASQILDSKAKIRAAAISGIHLINGTLDSIQNAQANCLDAPTGAFVASGLTQMLAAFVSGTDVGLTDKTAATTINKLVTYLSRDKKYISAIRSLNKAEFYTTLSCLIEMTSEGYCATEDAQVLLNEVKKDFTFVKKTVEPTTLEKKAGAQSIQVYEPQVKNFTSLLSQGAMAGHYILAHQLPIVTDWINKIQYGNEPQLPTEADFQVNAFNTGLMPFIKMKRILGDYNNKLNQLKNTTSLSAKQNLVKQMLFMVSDGFSTGNMDNGGENFFLRVHPANRLPFVLLGITNYSDMPSDVFIAKNNMTMDPQQYIEINFQTNMPQFKDPDQLAITIKKNAEDIYNKANSLAQQYFLSLFIPDEIGVVTESMVGMNKGDVRSALAEIDLYLKDFVARMSQPGGDSSFLTMARDLRNRIGVLLAHYKKLHEFGLSLVGLKTQGAISEAQLQDKMKTMARDFIQDVYDQFEIKKMRSGFLSYRMLMIVKKDYSISMQKRDFSNTQLKDLMMATGLESLQQLFNQSSLNFSSADMDLAQARDLYAKNLSALEQISRAPMANYINEQRLKADPNVVSQRDLWNEANRYSYHSEADRVPTDNSSFQWWRTVVGAANNLVEGLFGGFGVFNKDVNYGWPSADQQLFNTQLPNLTDTEDGASAKIWARGCSIVLAFYDLRPYWYICQKSILYSPFYDKERYANNPQLLKFFEDNLSLNFVKAAYQFLNPNINYASASNKTGLKAQLNKNRRARICALRDYYRKNYVMQVTAGLKRDNQVYTNEYSRIPERVVPKDTEQTVTPTPAPKSSDSQDSGDGLGDIDLSKIKPR